MPLTVDIEEVYQAIGEFVVFFQSIEDTYRQIGWYLVDPQKVDWPPRVFRKETNADLVNKVTDLFIALTKKYRFPNGAKKAEEAERLRGVFHALRKFRNRVVHSAYQEVVAGGQVAAILRSSPKITVDPDTGDIEFDQEIFDTATIRRQISLTMHEFFILTTIRTQLIHWSPFTRYESDT
jgi:hypothetical protein